MVELVKYIVTELVGEGKDFTVELENADEEYCDIVVTISSNDIGKIIGKQGKIAKAIRTIVKSATNKEGKKHNVVINEK